MIRNSRNIALVSKLDQNTQKYLNHIRENKMFPYIDEGLGYAGGAKIDSDSEVEEIIVKPKATGKEDLKFYQDLVGNGKYKKSMVSKVAKEIHASKPNLKEVVKHLKELERQDKLEGGNLGNFFKELMAKFSGIKESAKSLGKSVYKTFADPQNLDKHDLANVLTLGTAEGMNPAYKKKVEKERAREKRTKELFNPRDKKGYGKKSKEGGGLFDVIGDLLGMGKNKKMEGAAIYKKGKKGGAAIKQSEMVPTEQQKGSSMSGMGKRAPNKYQLFVKKIAAQKEFKGKPLKEVLKYIKENNLYKK